MSRIASASAVVEPAALPLAQAPDVPRRALQVNPAAWQVEIGFPDQTPQLALGLLGFSVGALIAYIVAGPDGTKQSVARPSIAGAAGT
jgi:hypothetical protein